MNILIKKINRRLKKWWKDVLGRFKQERHPSSAFISLFEAYHTGFNPPRVLLLGDSVAERVSWNDYDDRTLAEFVTTNLKKQTNVATVSYGGFTLHIFYHLVLALEKMKHKPELVVLPINMRNFSPQWDLEPTWQFEALVEQINRFIVDPSLPSFSGQFPREIISTEVFNTFDATPVEFALSPFDRIAQFRLMISAAPVTEEQRRFRLRQIFIFHYTNRLLRGHRKLVALESILKLLRSMGIPFLAYLTPLNVDAGMRLVGDEFAVLLHENVDVVSRLVSEYLTDGRSVFKDWSEMMRSDHFFHLDNATEHLNEAGRKILANAIADEVAAHMSEPFRDRARGV